jgi:hypothetical protein
MYCLFPMALSSAFQKTRYTIQTREDRQYFSSFLSVFVKELIIDQLFQIFTARRSTDDLALIVTFFVGQHVQMKGGNILDVKIYIFRRLGQVNYFDVAAAFVANINTVMFFAFYRKIGQ